LISERTKLRPKNGGAFYICSGAGKNIYVSLVDKVTNV